MLRLIFPSKNNINIIDILKYDENEIRNDYRHT